MAQVVLPMESKKREFLGRLWLALNLAEAGHEVAFGNKSSLYHSFDLLEPDIVFTVTGKDRKASLERLSKLNSCGASTLLLQPEGSAFPGEERFKNRVSPAAFERIDCYCAWGEAAAGIARNNNPAEYHEKITITGNPRFDLLSPELREVYREEAERISRQYSPYILVNTNFSINHIDLGRFKKYATRDMTETLGFHTEMLGHFMSMLPKLARRCYDQGIVIRPHPGENKEFYERFFSPFDEIYVEAEGEVRPWIMSADAVVHNSCTTGVTSALLQTPVFAYTPIESRVHGSPIPNIVSEQIDSEDELIKTVARRVDEDGPYVMSESQKSQLKRHIHNTDSLSVERIVDVVNNHAGSADGDFRTAFAPGTRKRLGRTLVKVFSDEIFNTSKLPISSPASMPEYKFPGLSVSEIRDGISKFQLCPDINHFEIETDPEIPQVVLLSSDS